MGAEEELCVFLERGAQVSSGAINSNYDVDSLCRSFPKRLLDLKTAQGERLKY